MLIVFNDATGNIVYMEPDLSEPTQDIYDLLHNIHGKGTVFNHFTQNITFDEIRAENVDGFEVDTTNKTLVLHYKPSDYDLQSAKAKKKDELSRACGQAITGKFTSTVGGVTYQFSYDAEAQANFGGMANALSRGYITQTTKWTMYDTNGNVVRQVMTASQFDIVAKDALTHVDTNISKLRDTLFPQVDAATTQAQIDAITW